jgi:hypothetical protein
MSTLATKVPGFEPGEFTRDPFDGRFGAVLSRGAGEADDAYIRRLAASGYAVILERSELAQGGYPRAKAIAVTKGVPLLVPLEEGERPVHAAFGDANTAPEGGERKPFDMVQFRREWQAEEARKKVLRDATRTTPI